MSNANVAMNIAQHCHLEHELCWILVGISCGHPEIGAFPIQNDHFFEDASKMNTWEDEPSGVLQQSIGTSVEIPIFSFVP